MYTEKLPEPPFIVKMLFEMNSYMVSPKNIIQYCKANLAEKVQKKGAKFGTFAIKGGGGLTCHPVFFSRSYIGVLNHS